MKIRRFYSKNMRTALRQVTEEFGEDAAILSSQKTPSGVEVIAALDYDEELLPSAVSGLKSSDLSYGENTSQEVNADFDENQKISVAANHDINTIEEPLDEHKTKPLPQVSEDALDNKKSLESKAKVTQLQWTTDPGLVAMKEELGLMRSMMSEQLKGIGWQRFSEKDPVKAMFIRRLTCLGISNKLIDELLPRVSLDKDAECSWQNLLALLAKSISTNCHNILSEGGVFAFMGPSGSGKTTTIAKIAARFVIKHGVDSVALISTDNYRISAQQQLANFARILGIKMSSVTNNKPIDTLLNQYRGKKLVLIDTAGMSHGEEAIAKQLDSLLKLDTNIKRFLMIPATNQLSVIRNSIDLYKPYSPYSVIISKLDEAASLGEVISLLAENKLPVAFTTDGQRVPEDIRTARGHSLVSKAVWLANKYGVNPDEWQLAQEQQYAQYG